jgi:hypothetical protein
LRGLRKMILQMPRKAETLIAIRVRLLREQRRG